MPTDSPQQDKIFLVYVAVLLAILIVAGGVLAFLTFVIRRNLRPVWATYGSWWVLAPLAFGAIYLGRRPTILLFILFALMGFREFARATQLCRERLMTAAGYLLVLAAGIAAMMRNPHNGSTGWYGLYMTLPAYAVALFVLIPILQNRTEGQFLIMSVALLGFLYVGWMFLHVALIADVPGGGGFLLYLLLAVELNDVAAYLFGRLLGRDRKHLLRSQVSPKKTWEGALGALVFSMILPWLLRFSFPNFGPVQLLLTGLIVGVGGQLGDLGMSVIKRGIGVKDMGSLIPGHGGVLDRIDSLIYSSPLFLHMIRFYGKQG
ncbi:MAG TPA: phosphatidate cytidylyltransferase [Tepidisphaeraceae bacterium]|jgi:phosphatidate cytidylyltransferase